MPIKNLQKPAAPYREKQGIHRGLLDPQRFAQNIHLRCYEPSSGLKPFVAHCFVARFEVLEGTTYTAVDVLSQPVVNLFFTAKKSCIKGVTTPKRTFKVKGAGVYAGVKFKPGGFYAFWQGEVARLTEKTISITKVFPSANKAFVRSLLAVKDDYEIVARIEALLRTKRPRYDTNIELVGKITAAIEADHRIHTVAAVAKIFDTSERSLQHLFQTYVGVGVKWVIMRARFLEAAQHAHTPEKPNWTAIAAELGYSTQSHFINDFKRLVGQSPSNYIKTMAEPLQAFSFTPL